eukprot:CAMPEP_0204212458 /NCGR_PEP_ID=MMETSP0361-20130328/75253_1 /ASSEMBLY_ACC=CAM_ASM_000343 /TAXON_ID=268821 /ORGANISM="Scrippsiella Hangoei, Strain SHTV-5" /LENGTH=238 /DNA_ID=CAMNT_0051176789 /DNA_START=17 /DNA_END=730 /DNA_ORIENTATION=+
MAQAATARRGCRRAAIPTDAHARVREGVRGATQPEVSSCALIDWPRHARDRRDRATRVRHDHSGELQVSGEARLTPARPTSDLGVCSACTHRGGEVKRNLGTDTGRNSLLPAGRTTGSANCGAAPHTSPTFGNAVGTGEAAVGQRLAQGSEADAALAKEAPQAGARPSSECTVTGLMPRPDVERGSPSSAAMLRARPQLLRKALNPLTADGREAATPTAAAPRLLPAAAPLSAAPLQE